MEILKIVLTVLFIIAIQILNLYLIAIKNFGSSFVLGAEALALTIVGSTYYTRKHLQISLPGKNDVDIVNVLALTLSLASVFTPWVLREENKNYVNYTYAALGLFGAVLIGFDIIWNYLHPKKNITTYDSTTVVIEEGSTTTIVTKIQGKKLPTVPPADKAQQNTTVTGNCGHKSGG